MNLKLHNEQESEDTSVEVTQASAAIDILTNSYKQSQACQDTVRRVAEICAMVSYSLVIINFDSVTDINFSCRMGLW